MKGKIMIRLTVRNASVRDARDVGNEWRILSGSSTSAQPAFPSAAEAGQSLFQAVQSNNEQAIAEFWWADGTHLSSDDVKTSSTANCSSKIPGDAPFGSRNQRIDDLYIGAKIGPSLFRWLRKRRLEI